MKRLIAIGALLLVAPALVWAGNDPIQGQFCFFIAPIVSNTQYINTTTKVGGNNTGFGGEVLFHKAGLGVGVELGYAGPDWSFDGNGAVGVGSIDGFFCNKSPKRVAPFVGGGYSLYFGQRTTTRSGYNLGGGVNIWAAKHAALRLELRHQGGINGFHAYSQFNHFVALRFGMTFK